MTNIMSVDELNDLHKFDKSNIIFDIEEETIIDDKKYITIYTKGESGIITKSTKIYKIETLKIKVPKALAERRKWEKFGVSKGLPSGPDKASTNIVYDEVFFEFTNRNKIKDDKEDDVGSIFGSSNKSTVKCKHCGGNHWSIKCSHKPDPKDTTAKQPNNSIENSGKYVPKFKRDGNSSCRHDLVK